MLRIGALLIALVTAAPPALAEASRDCQSNNHEAGDPGVHAADPAEPAQRRRTTTTAPSAIAKLGKIDLALADYNRAIELNPRYYEALNNRGTIYMSRSDNERALAGLHPLDRSRIRAMRSRTTTAARRSRT